ncbi:hypothetical protein [Chryseobacterium sp. MFBS3-17]|uniref:hypothetical protein n=1 Tax=Chryseobacterium sp. MFBS3-17 TaxID=2886689 RepID=UPI001D0EC38E|nr:hypothetical protein [Chryseobacterium sp. MFBS3-17]MCC2590342.1 hypothetical protein [Chryseobacterium sp. MFBS3-17]
MRIKTETRTGQLSYYVSGTLHIAQVMDFLQARGYRVQSWVWIFLDETFPGGITRHEVQTFVALKPGEEPAEDKIFSRIFEKELRTLLRLAELP